MTYEKIKNILLIILVGCSIVLTFNLWTYRPNLTPVENPGQAIEPIGDDKEYSEVIRPSQLIHFYDDKKIGTTLSVEIDQITNDMSKWELLNLANVSNDIGSLHEWIEKTGHSILVYPDEVSLNAFREVIPNIDKNATDFSFDTIVIDMNSIEDDIGLAYFIARDQGTVFRGEVQGASIADFRTKYYDTASDDEDFYSFLGYQGQNERMIYVPDEHIPVSTQRIYLMDKIKPRTLMESLFSDPSVVQESTTQPSMIEYTDSTSIMRVYEDRNMISYKNISSVVGDEFVGMNLLRRSIDFMNAHKGWTGNYRYFEEVPESNKVVFRLFHNQQGIPIFSDYHRAKIEVELGDIDINEYTRSNFALGTIVSGGEESRLLSGKEVIKEIEQLPNFDRNLLQDVTVAYELKVEKNMATTNSEIINLQPAWYYRYNNEWKKFTKDEFIPN